jgi:hypothetical protein
LLETASCESGRVCGQIIARPDLAVGPDSGVPMDVRVRKRQKVLRRVKRERKKRTDKDE